MKNILYLLVFLLGTIVGIMVGHVVESHDSSPPPQEADSIIIKGSFYLLPPKEGLEEALEYYGVAFPEIVYAQAILETGHFTSSICKNKNNLFGLYDSTNKEYMKFDHWSQSVEAYKDKIQNKYSPPTDYYQFLQDLGYAEDPEYINKLKIIVKKHKK